MSLNEKKWGLALGGGGIKAFAHLGLLQLLEEHKLKPSMISSVSAGALVGVFYAAGYTAEEAYKFFHKHNLWSFTAVNFPSMGLLSLSQMGNLLKNEISYTKLEDLPIPITIACTNLNLGRIEYFNNGPLVDLVQASSSIPILFSPVKLNERHWYVDGGLIDNLPVAPLVDHCESIIGANLNPIKELHNIENMKDIASRVFQLSIQVDRHMIEEHCDLVIEAEELIQYDLLDADQADDLYQLGYETAKKYLPKMKELLQ
jgi:NTE family protein